MNNDWALFLIWAIAFTLGVCMASADVVWVKITFSALAVVALTLIQKEQREQ